MNHVNIMTRLKIKFLQGMGNRSFPIFYALAGYGVKQMTAYSQNIAKNTFKKSSGIPELFFFELFSEK